MQSAPAVPPANGELQIVSHFRGHRHFPVVISHFEASHGRQARWKLYARNATNAIRESWTGTSWIIELVTPGSSF